jgi:hypothetical protein
MCCDTADQINKVEFDHRLPAASRDIVPDLWIVRAETTPLFTG